MIAIALGFVVAFWRLRAATVWHSRVRLTSEQLDQRASAGWHSLSEGQAQDLA